MCRLLLIKNKIPFSIQTHLETFALTCKNSKEYQGHGWGYSYLHPSGKWITQKHLPPIWTHDHSNTQTTTFLIAHARSAFQNKDITIENNMPFQNQNFIFTFNGELHGVKLNAEGRIGAEKIFNFIQRLNKSNTLETMKKATRLITKRTGYIRAMNILMTDTQTQQVFLCSHFNEDPEYFSMHKKTLPGGFIVCSTPYPNQPGWEKIPNQAIEVLS